MIDGVLANVTVHMAGGDEGASAAIANGNVNVTSGHSSPYTILVGGTSIATLSAALTDPTLSTPTESRGPEHGAAGAGERSRRPSSPWSPPA